MYILFPSRATLPPQIAPRLVGRFFLEGEGGRRGGREKRGGRRKDIRGEPKKMKNGVFAKRKKTEEGMAFEGWEKKSRKKKGGKER